MLHRLSGYDFNGVIGPVTYVCKDFTTVAVSIRGTPGARDIPVRFAVWGAYLVGQYLAQWKQARNSVFALVYDRSLVGYIEFARRPVQLSLAGSSNDTQTQIQTADTVWNAQLEAAPLSHSSGNITLVSPDDNQEIMIGYLELPGQDFTKWELFANIYAQLAYIGAFPPRQQIRSPWAVSSSSFPRSQTTFTPEGSPSPVVYRHVAGAFITIAFQSMV
ncbi:MAG: hypothetical protein Q9166_000305 [cf. Caloplaca sp. 2 TL-2023]